jgi:hypothetical protein
VIYTQKEQIKEKIDELVNDVVEGLKKELNHCLESITLTGSYTIGKISLERPNVNILIFVKPNVSAIDYLRIGEIFYEVSEKYQDYFGIKIDCFPFRFGFPVGKKELQFLFTPHILFINEKNAKPPFGIASNVLEGMKKTRKVVFGSDPLGKVDLTYTKKDVIQWALFDIGVLYRNQLIDASLAYDIRKNLDLLVGESIEIGKNALTWGTEIFLDEEDWKNGKHIELIMDKEKMIDFYQIIDKELGEAAKIILEARLKFQEYKSDKEKASKLYDAAYTAVTKVLLKTLSETKK